MCTARAPQEKQVDNGTEHVTYPRVKRGEHIVLKRLGLTSGMCSPSKSAMKTYEEIFSGDPDNMQTLRELFPPNGDVFARK